ncbi:MAG: cupin domain-containing protein [Rhodospirillales bacterium]|nr:cupin domain-containing protein [Rhodospirillales bacterium]
MSEKPADVPGHVTLARAVSALAERRPSDRPFAQLIARGTLRVGPYAPRGSDTRQPHDQDEVYVVMSGRGTFRNGPASHDFRPGDVLFVPAGVPHAFEDFSDDLYVWVVFYGPTGGEAAS